MTSSATFILYLILPFLAWATFQKFALTKKRMILLFSATVIAGSSLYVVGVHLNRTELQHDLDLYDLDQDGGFSESELTPAAQEAMELVGHTGREFAPVIGPIATTFWVSFAFGVCFLVRLGISDIRAYRSKSRAEQSAASDHH